MRCLPAIAGSLPLRRLRSMSYGLYLAVNVDLESRVSVDWDFARPFQGLC